MFEIMGYIDDFATYGNTQHVAERSKRAQIAQRLIIEEHAKVCCIALVNKGHEHGIEAHVIYNNGIVKVYNASTHKYVTMLIAREVQIERYNVKITKTMRTKIRRHIAEGYNHI